MKRKRSPYIALLLSILLIFAYMILFLLLIFKYDFAAVFMEKFINLFKNKEIAEALFVTIFFLIPISVIYAVINRKSR